LPRFDRVSKRGYRSSISVEVRRSALGGKVSGDHHWGWGLLIAVSSACVACKGSPKVPEEPESCIATEARLTSERIDAILRPNIVQVRSDEGSGSGFILGADDDSDVIVVTNYHVIAGGETFSVIFVRPDGRRLQVSGVEVVKTDPDNDLALLKAPRMSVFGRGLRLAGPPKMGQSVSTLGYPVLDDQDAAPQLTSGFVSSVDRKLDRRHFVLTDLQLIPGNSGGAAVDSCGNVVGVASAHHAEATHIGGLVAADKVRSLRERYLVARPATEAEIRKRLHEFVLSLQRDDARQAASFFSRGFYSEWLFPRFKEAIREANNQFAELETFLQRRGKSVTDLDADQLRVAMMGTGTVLTPPQVLALQVLAQAKQNGWDRFTMLREFFSPFVDESFGSVRSLRVEEVREQEDYRVTHVVLTGSNGRETHMQIPMIYEWGDWHIAGYRVTNAGSDENEADVATSESGQSRDWYPVKSR
jgi:S1-C subfamily serine protease